MIGILLVHVYPPHSTRVFLIVIFITIHHWHDSHHILLTIILPTIHISSLSSMPSTAYLLITVDIIVHRHPLDHSPRDHQLIIKICKKTHSADYYCHHCLLTLIISGILILFCLVLPCVSPYPGPDQTIFKQQHWFCSVFIFVVFLFISIGFRSEWIPDAIWDRYQRPFRKGVQKNLLF